MSEPKQILIAPTGGLRDEDKAALRKAGVLIVETDNPSDVRLMEAETTPFGLPNGALAKGLAAALGANVFAREAFALSIAESLRKAAHD